MRNEFRDTAGKNYIYGVRKENDMVAKENTDAVNHPNHYAGGKFECIEVMLETQGKDAVKAFCICNAFKYLFRHEKKNGLEDIKKAAWYLNKYIELEETNGE